MTTDNDPVVSPDSVDGPTGDEVESHAAGEADPPHSSVAVVVAPRSADWIEQAVVSGGGRVVGPAEASAVVWTAPSQPDELAIVLDSAPGIEWVQLPWAGVDPYVDLMRTRRDLAWTSAKGVYAEPVAEHGLALLLAGFRNLGPYSRASTWSRPAGRNLLNARVTILGGGGIARSLVRLLIPFRVEVTVVRRSTEGPGLDDAAAGFPDWGAGGGSLRVLGGDRLAEALDGADALVLALPLLPETRRLIGQAELARLAPGAWLVNLARGEHVDTDALLAALDLGILGGAALDVTDPEPLPDGHPLWHRDNVIITPHTANTPEMARPLLSERISTNVAAYAAGRPFTGIVDTDLGY